MWRTIGKNLVIGGLIISIILIAGCTQTTGQVTTKPINQTTNYKCPDGSIMANSDACSNIPKITNQEQNIDNTPVTKSDIQEPVKEITNKIPLFTCSDYQKIMQSGVESMDSSGSISCVNLNTDECQCTTTIFNQKQITTINLYTGKLIQSQITETQTSSSSVSSKYEPQQPIHKVASDGMSYYQTPDCDNYIVEREINAAQETCNENGICGGEYIDDIVVCKDTCKYLVNNASHWGYFFIRGLCVCNVCTKMIEGELPQINYNEKFGVTSYQSPTCNPDSPNRINATYGDNSGSWQQCKDSCSKTVGQTNNNWGYFFVDTGICVCQICK